MTFYGQFIDGKHVDEVLLTKYFPDNNSGFFIECGAHDGISDSCCKIFEEKGWTGINIEPFPPIYEKLLQNRKTSLANLNVALSNKIGPASFASTMDIYTGCGAIVPDDFIPYATPDNRTNLTKYSIMTTTYKEIITRFDIKNIDLFVLDVEGHELEVFEGMGDCTVLPQMMCIEYGHVGLDKIKNAAKKIGLRLDMSDRVNAFFVRRT